MVFPISLQETDSRGPFNSWLLNRADPENPVLF